MNRLAWVALAVGLGACGQHIDDRPITVQYVTETILAPSCGTAECHSAFKQEDGYVFDTVDSALTSINNSGLVVCGEPEGSYLIQVMTRTKDRMPEDQPIANKDLELLEDWIANETGSDGVVCVGGQ
ncbi:MAG TPA: c-type cytochrome domain-containing protein [Kofleriaceae bacterium]|jgi:hypothetical protein